MSSAYLTYTQAEAYEGIERLPKPQGLPYECHKCHGYGGWVLQYNAYGPGRHFKAACNDCNGWGYTARPVDHVHEWGAWKNVGRCLHQCTCLQCGKTIEVDSGD